MFQVRLLPETFPQPETNSVFAGMVSVTFTATALLLLLVRAILYVILPPGWAVMAPPAEADFTAVMLFNCSAFAMGAFSMGIAYPQLSHFSLASASIWAPWVLFSPQVQAFQWFLLSLCQSPKLCVCTVGSVGAVVGSPPVAGAVVGAAVGAVVGVVVGFVVSTGFLPQAAMLNTVMAARSRAMIFLIMLFILSICCSSQRLQ